MASFKVGDKVKLKPAEEWPSNEPFGLNEYVKFGEVYTVAETVDNVLGKPAVVLVGHASRIWAERFERVERPSADITVPQRGDEVEVVLRAKVAGVLRVDDPTVDVARTVVYLQGDAPGVGQSVYLYDDHEDGVRSLTIVEPAKPKLDLDALPEKTVIQADTGEIYVKRSLQLCYSWADMNGGTLSSFDLWTRHDELVELVRKTEVA